MDRDLIAVWYTRIPDNKNTVRYQRAKTLSEEYDAEFYVFGNPPDHLGIEHSLHTCPGGIFSYVIFPLWVILHSLLRSKDFQIIHTAGVPATIVGYVCAWYGKRWIVDIWDDPELAAVHSKERGTIIGYIDSLYQRFNLTIIDQMSLYEGADEIILSMNEEFSRVIDIDDDLVTSIPNGTNTELYNNISSNKTTGNLNIIYVGFVNKKNGVKTILESMERLSRGHSDINLTIVGLMDAPIYSWLKREVRDRCIKSNVTIHRNLSHTETLKLIKRSDVGLCMFPHEREFEYIYPIKIFEYMMLESVVIASELKGISDIIDHEHNGLLIEPNEPNVLAENVVSIRNNELNHVTIVSNANEDVKQYDWDSINKTVIKVIEPS